jgi:hypothetical protein
LVLEASAAIPKVYFSGVDPLNSGNCQRNRLTNRIGIGCKQKLGNWEIDPFSYTYKIFLEAFIAFRPVPIRQMLFAWLCLAIIKKTWWINIGCRTKQCLGALATPPLGAASPACLLGFKNFCRQVNNARWRSEWPTLTAPTQLQPVPTRCECAILT